MAFIRAPFVESAGPDAEIIAEVDGNIVGVKYGNQIGISFHPEVTDCIQKPMNIFCRFVKNINNQ